MKTRPHAESPILRRIEFVSAVLLSGAIGFSIATIRPMLDAPKRNGAAIQATCAGLALKDGTYGLQMNALALAAQPDSPEKQRILNNPDAIEFSRYLEAAVHALCEAQSQIDQMVDAGNLDPSMIAAATAALGMPYRPKDIPAR